MATQLAEAPEAVETVDAANDTEAQTRDYEAEAREMGWKPPEEFEEGKKPPVVRTAQEFVEYRDQHLGLKNKEAGLLKRQLAQTQKLLNKVMEAERNSYQNALADIRAQMKEAVESGDVSAFEKLEARADTIRAKITEDTQSNTHGEDPMDQFDAFRDENTWYDKGGLAGASDVEKEARAFADRLAEKYVRQGLDKELPPSEFFSRIASETAEKFPALTAKNVRQKPPSDVAGVTRPGQGKGAKVGANLPAIAKETAERYMRLGIFKVGTKAEAYDLFAKSYTGPWN